MIRRLALAALIWLAADAVAHACPVCFQFEDGPTASGVRAAVIVLLTVTIGVLAAVGWWIARSSLFSSPPREPM
jgi:glycerol-3-phosphate acyltransferase PlsY